MAVGSDMTEVHEAALRSLHPTQLAVFQAAVQAGTSLAQAKWTKNLVEYNRS